MIKYQSNSHHKHTTSSPQIDSLFLMAKLAATAGNSQRQTEKDQINSIRTMGRYLFEEEEGSQVTFQEHNNQTLSIEKGISSNNALQSDIYQRGQISQRKKFQKIVQANQTENRKIKQMANTSRNTLNLTKSNATNESLTQTQTHRQIHRKKQSYMIKQVLKRCIREEEQFYRIREKEKQFNYSKSGNLLKHTKSNYLHPKDAYPLHNQKEEQTKGKKTATKDELKLIFEEVNKRGDELKKRKQAKIQKYQEEKYQKEMDGVTFHPALESSMSLRKNCTKGFLQRLKQDEHTRERDKVQILATQLKKDPFEPRLNTHKNSLSKSKIDSFRYQDSIFFTNRSRPELNFQKNLSRFIYPEEQSRSLTSSKANQSIEVPINTNDLKFLFQ